ncbi:hypothetical protein E2C01_045981 [Portunus trituberculatus]|uniref:Uncharacterized protein n=1 Tax=Portunus trituberculatus TaxID=210409 RepID=A0A5B7FWK1_PORTR|nr:hypothetical protein [Portunus trituberculatus]
MELFYESELCMQMAECRWCSTALAWSGGGGEMFPLHTTSPSSLFHTRGPKWFRGHVCSMWSVG